MSKKKVMSIGHWAEKSGAQLRTLASWHLMCGAGETFALVSLRVVVLRNSAIIASLDLGPVMRGSSRPADAGWEPGSPEVAEAEDLKVRAEATKVDHIPAVCFRGYDYVMPWERITPRERMGLWKRIKRLFVK